MRSLFASVAPEPEKVPDKPTEQEPVKPAVRCSRVKNVHFEKRIRSEIALEQVVDWYFEPGMSYHCISQGDVDSLTYLRMAVRQQPLEYVLLSTWCMAITDVKELELWLERGYIGHLDVYVGEIFQGTYREVYDYLKGMMQRLGKGRVCIFRNHSKVMVGFGERFDFAIESSANVNTNPRCEQTCITVDSGLAYFYKDFFDGINSFSDDFSGWSKYELKRDL